MLGNNIFLISSHDYDTFVHVPLNLVNILLVCQFIVSVTEPFPDIEHNTSKERDVAEVPKPSVQGILQSQWKFQEYVYMYETQQ